MFALVLGGPWLTAGCTGEVSGYTDDSDGAVGAGAAGSGSVGNVAGNAGVATMDCSNVHVAASPLRRLTRAEYDNTVHDLLGDDTKPSSKFPEEGGAGFDNNADVSVVTRLVAEKYQAASEQLAAAAVSNLVSLLGCDPAGSGERNCIQTFVSAFGERAWRRPLDSDEQAAMLALFDAMRAKYDLTASVRTLTASFLQSPNFLYRVELGGEAAPGGAALKLSSWERASRLSYFLWESMPDAALRELARSGALASPDTVAATARQMLGDPRTRETVRHFHRQWLMLGDLTQLDKDRATFPNYSDAMGASFSAAMDAYVDHVIWDADAKLSTFFTAPIGYADGNLAKLWGLSGTFGSTPSLVDNSQLYRFGVLSQGPLMAALSNPNVTNPVKRGLMVRQQILCQTPPPPPEGVNTTLPPPTPSTTTRQRLERHRASPSCAACHKLFDPLGLAFENYDAVGAYRDHDGSSSVDATGELIMSDVDGPFANATQLSTMLSKSKDVEACVALQWFRYSQGRIESDSDQCSVNQARAALAKSDGDVKELLVALTQTDAFLYRTLPSQENP